MPLPLNSPGGDKSTVKGQVGLNSNTNSFLNPVPDRQNYTVYQVLFWPYPLLGLNLNRHENVIFNPPIYIAVKLNDRTVTDLGV